jgi:hypothetical protein
MSYKLYSVYRFSNDDGSEKVWCIRENGDGTFTTAWGKSTAKKTLNTKGIKTPSDVQKLIRSKLNKGYVDSGTLWIDDNGQSNFTDIFSKDSISAPFIATELPLFIYWRVKFPVSSDTSNAWVAFFNGSYNGYIDALLAEYPDSSWLKTARSKNFCLTQGAGSLTKNHGVASLLLLMALKKLTASTNHLTITLSHEDSVEISDQLKMESVALSFFDTDMESVRHIAEDIGLIDKRLDLSLVAPELKDYYF